MIVDPYVIEFMIFISNHSFLENYVHKVLERTFDYICSSNCILIINRITLNFLVLEGDYIY